MAVAVPSGILHLLYVGLRNDMGQPCTDRGRNSDVQ